ncbi:MAG: DUF1440 domain-containing protein [Actinomycetota bacterium]|nr:DUF1440 domain-containing protein [Actinomycetota bacterium]
MNTTTARGAGAGAVGVLAMDVVTWFMYRQEPPTDRSRERRARAFGMDTAHALVRRVAQAVGSDAGSQQPNGAGILVHYGLGMGPAAGYARWRHRYPWLRTGRGALYGFGLFVVNDEIGSRLLGIAGPQRDYPWPAHLRGLVGHVVLGMVTEATLDAIEA